jgi:hypothetical protein
MGKMGYIKQNNDDKFDFDLSAMDRQINIDEAFKNEQPSLIILNDFLNSKVEVKCQNTAKSTLCVFIEYKTSKWDKETRKHLPFVNSGILTSKSDYYVLTCYDLITVIPTAFLLFLYTNRKKFIKEHGEDNFRDKPSSVEYNPIAQGMIIKYHLLITLYLGWINNGQYITYRLKKFKANSL